MVLSLLLAFHPRAVESFARTGYPDWVRVLLAWSEALAAALFLIPRTFWVGAWLLLGVLAGAAVLHVVLRESPAALLVYMAIIAAIMLHRRGGRGTAGVVAGTE
jgi:hypothetical protein